MDLLSKIQPQKTKTRKQQIAEWRENIPEKYRGTYDQAMKGNGKWETWLLLVKHVILAKEIFFCQNEQGSS